MRAYPKPDNFSGTKFAARYNLNALLGEFWADANFIYVPDNLPDDPPIFDLLDPLIPAPPGVWVHEMKALTKKVGDKLIDGEGTSCFHIVVETEAKLNDPWFTGITIDTGSSAYVMDKGKTIIWDGTKWK